MPNIPNTPPPYNEELVRLAAPILLAMPDYFSSNIFDRESVKRVLTNANCPSNLTETVIENCTIAGIIEQSDGGNTIKIITSQDD